MGVLCFNDSVRLKEGPGYDLTTAFVHSRREFPESDVRLGRER